MSKVFTGSCQCRHIQYRIVGKPLTVFNCHCTECQKQSSSAFAMALWVKHELVDIITGELKTWIRDLPSGGTMACDFCPDCGTRIFYRHETHNDMISIKPGNLDDTSWLKPAGNIWTDSAQTWFSLGEDSLSYNRNPDSYDELIKRFACS